MKKTWDNPREHSMPEHARVPASFHIGGVKIAPATVLAPMAGVTDTVFRRFIRNASLFTTPGLESDTALNFPESVDAEITNQQSGCGLIMTEFTSADGLARMRESKRKRYLTFYDDEHPIAAQLFGSNPATLADAARIVQDTGFDLVDLNLGCPAKRVVACNGGSGLLRDLPLIGKIFETDPRSRHRFPSPSSSASAGTIATSSMSRSPGSRRNAASTPSRCTLALASRATPARRAGSISPPSKMPCASRSSATETSALQKTPSPWSRRLTATR